MPFIDVRGLRKDFVQADGSLLRVLDGISLGIREGEIIALFGPNGCGKTTLLLIIAGLEQPTGGRVKVRGACPEEASTGIVFQNSYESSLPWRTVQGNVEFSLEARGVKRHEKRALAEKYLKRVGLLEHKDKYPYQLSGGLRQLTAIARALAYEPRFFVMDEPFSALDYQTRLSMEERVLGIHDMTKKTMIFVSHDVEEAIFLADRVVVLSNRPAKIKEIVEVSLPRPRKKEMRLSRIFFKTRNRVLEAFKEGE